MLDKSTILAIDWGGHALNFLAFVSLTWDTILCVCVFTYLQFFIFYLSHSRIKIDIVIQLCETMGECIFTHQTNYWAPLLSNWTIGLLTLRRNTPLWTPHHPYWSVANFSFYRLDNFSFGLNITRFQNKPKSWPTYPWIDGDFFFFPLDSI